MVKLPPNKEFFIFETYAFDNLVILTISTSTENYSIIHAKNLTTFSQL